MRLHKLLSHLNIILGGMFIVFFCIDQVNTAMGFIDNDISKWLLLIMSVLTIWQAIVQIRSIRRKEVNLEKRRETEAYGKDTEAYKVATDFVDRYSKKFGAAPSTFAGHAYDALYLTVEAMKRLPEGFTSAQLRDEIEKTSGFVGIGGTFTFSPTDHNGMTEKDLVMYKVEGGKWVLVE
jgi:hypothetical protein